MPIARPIAPIVAVESATFKSSVTGWKNVGAPASGSTKEFHLVAVGRWTAAIVISRDCDLDHTPNGQVLVAPLRPIAGYDVPLREQILQQSVKAFLPVPDLPDGSTSAAELRFITSMRRDLVAQATRVCSMSDEGKFRLAAQLRAFFSPNDQSVSRPAEH